MLFLCRSEHKSWYSWVLSSLVSCVYTFGCDYVAPMLLVVIVSCAQPLLVDPCLQLHHDVPAAVPELQAAVGRAPAVAHAHVQVPGTTTRLSSLAIEQRPLVSVSSRICVQNTFIDDLFAFVITMPTLHRLSVFR